MVSHLQFQPETVVVRVGQPVVWQFGGEGVVYQVTGLSGPNAALAHYSSPQKETGTWEHTFTTPGTYRYECGLHTYMHGEVIVQAN
jgi:plastocyanin